MFTCACTTLELWYTSFRKTSNKAIVSRGCSAGNLAEKVAQVKYPILVGTVWSQNWLVPQLPIEPHAINFFSHKSSLYPHFDCVPFPEHQIQMKVNKMLKSFTSTSYSHSRVLETVLTMAAESPVTHRFISTVHVGSTCIFLGTIINC